MRRDSRSALGVADRVERRVLVLQTVPECIAPVLRMAAVTESQDRTEVLLAVTDLSVAVGTVLGSR
jgi:hypothetical protein